MGTKDRKRVGCPNFALFFFSRSQFHFSSLWCLFGGVLVQAHLRVPTDHNTTKIPRGDPQREEERHEKTPRERKKDTRRPPERGRKTREDPRERKKDTRRPPERGRKTQKWEREKEKKRELLGGPAAGGPAEGGPGPGQGGRHGGVRGTWGGLGHRGGGACWSNSAWSHQNRPGPTKIGPNWPSKRLRPKERSWPK